MRLYKQVTRTPPGTPTFSLAYLIVSLLFVGLGGCLAVAWNDDHPVKCIGVGAGLPAFVSALALSHKTGRSQ